MKLEHDTRKGNLKLLTSRKYSVLKYKMRSSLMSNDKVVNMKYPFNRKKGVVQILGSCNGLICASREINHIIYIWNPCTKEYKLILSPKKPVGFQSNRSLESTDHNAYGFGYDSQNSDYKFVSIFSKRNMDVSRVEIYSLGSDSWKTYESGIPYKLSRGDPGTGVFVNGALHWFAKSNKSKSRVILCFDLEEEIFKEIPQPADVPMDGFDYRFVDVLRGRLCLLCSVSKVGFEIWEMKTYGVRKSWSKLFKTDLQLMMALDISSYHYIRSAVVLKDGEILLQIRLHDDKTYSDFKWQERSNVVGICWEEEKGRHINIRKYMYMKNLAQMVPRLESLVSVNTGTHVGDPKEREDYNEAYRGMLFH
ncbi:F-box/kelch-repeat protein At3g06240-like [Papaver somniferum]|uniref:F-box/kelch-repeat protein At3g06240-like n=1 Tax=Papaver somniferum TaxID=3469 RepID=UPI000E6F5E78|nr:F-box/kelch-repeat protein At3g06240-like [Papaver somniferum]